MLNFTVFAYHVISSNAVSAPVERLYIEQ